MNQESTKHPNVRILVVDDDRASLLLLQKIIAKEGYVVETAASAVFAMNLVDKGKFHIVITDIVMPDMDGLDLLAAIKKRDPLTQVVMMTAGVSMSRTLLSLELGAADFMLKPVDPEEMLLVIRLCEAKLERWLGIIRASVHRNNAARQA